MFIDAPNVFNSKHPVRRQFFIALLNITLVSLAAFAVVGSAGCALRIVLKY